MLCKNCNGTGTPLKHDRHFGARCEACTGAGSFPIQLEGFFDDEDNEPP